MKTALRQEISLSPPDLSGHMTKRNNEQNLMMLLPLFAIYYKK